MTPAGPPNRAWNAYLATLAFTLQSCFSRTRFLYCYAFAASAAQSEKSATLLKSMYYTSVYCEDRVNVY